jgi:arylsulfatase A
MKYYTLVIYLLVLVLGERLFPGRALAAESPNIAFILADDLGTGDVKCYGGDRCKIEAPNIDQLSADGVRFTDAHVNASVCQPTRVAIMTGRYPWHFGSSEPGGALGYIGPRFSDSTFTIADLLHQTGYECGYVGNGTWEFGCKHWTVRFKAKLTWTLPNR